VRKRGDVWLEAAGRGHCRQGHLGLTGSHSNALLMLLMYLSLRVAGQ
jgi:hypothetical protein